MDYPLLYHFLWHIVFFGVALNCSQHLGIISQPIDEHLTLGQLKWADLDAQLGADVIDNPVDAAAQKPPGTGN